MGEGGALDEVGLVGARSVERGSSRGLLAAAGGEVDAAEHCPEGGHGQLQRRRYVSLRGASMDRCRAEKSFCLLGTGGIGGSFQMGAR